MCFISEVWTLFSIERSIEMVKIKLFSLFAIIIAFYASALAPFTDESTSIK